MDVCAEIRSLRKSRGGLRSRLSILQKELSSLLSEEGKRFEVEEIQSAIADYVSRIRAIQERMEMVMESGDDLEQEMQEAMALEASVRATQVEIRKYLSRLPSEEQDANGKSVLSVSANGEASKPLLPKWELPKFDGNVLDFPAFWDQFEAAVHSRDDVNDVTRFVYLRAALTGSALKAVSRYSVTAANYPIVVQVLKNRFGKPRVIVERHISALVQMERCESASTHYLRKLHDTFVQHVRALAALEKDPLKGQLTAADVLITICKQKLPTSVRKRWESKLAEHGQQEEDLNDLLEYIESCLEVEECLSEGSGKERSREKNGYGRKERLSTASTLQSSVMSHQNCTACQGGHKVAECNDFLSMNVKSRWRLAKASRLCFVCLRPGHSATNCKERSSGNKECHELLREKAPPLGESDTRRTAKEDPFKVGVAKTSCNAAIGLQIAIAKAHGHSGLSCKVMCLLDPGSQRTFIKKDLADRLGLNGPRESVVITTIGDRRTRCKVKRAELWLSPMETNRDNSVTPISIEGLCLPKICSKVSANQPLRNEWTHLQCLKLADQFPRDQAEVDVLIGLDYYYEFVGTEQRKGKKNEPVAVKSVFGWIVCGKMSDAVNHTAVLLHDELEEGLEAEIKKSWELESTGMKYKEAQEETSQAFIKRLKQSVTYNGERYVVRLPWKMKNPNLPNNFEYAVSRLKQTENCLKNGNLRNTYAEAIKAYVANEWAEEILEETETRGKTWYLPHHAVYREEKVSTQCRIVFDASARHEGHSLNEALEAGPA